MNIKPMQKQNLSYFCIIIILLLSCTNIATTPKKQPNEIKNLSIIPSKYLVVRVDDQQKMLFLETDIFLKLVDTIFSYQINGELYNYPENFPKIDPKDSTCFFFEYELDETGEDWVFNDLICVDLKAGNSIRIGSFKEYEIREWDIDFNDKMLYFTNSLNNTLYRYDMQNSVFTRIENFGDRRVWHLNFSFTSDCINIFYKEDGITKQATYHKNDFVLLEKKSIFKTPSNFTNLFFIEKNDMFAEVVQNPEPTFANFGKICLYNMQGPLLSKVIDYDSYPSGGHNRSIFWLGNHLIIIGGSVLYVYDDNLELVKKFTCGNIIPIFSNRDDMILLTNNDSTPSYYMLLPDLSWVEVQSPHLKNIMVMMPLYE